MAERIRAIVRKNVSEVDEVSKLFAGPTAKFFASQVVKSSEKFNVVIATTITDAYEMALETPALYTGVQAKEKMLQDLKDKKFKVKIVTEESFANLLEEDQKSLTK